MRILQLIDSLDAGGAERMAVNYANALTKKVTLSALVVTRKEGVLKQQLETNVAYLFLQKKKTFDVKAIFKLKIFVKEYKINFIHAHGTSFFTAFLLKIIYPKIKIIWHNHFGGSQNLNKITRYILKSTIFFFKGCIVVSEQLKIWGAQKLKIKNILYLPNFVVQCKIFFKETYLKGIENKKIVMLANLRLEKNHFLLLNVAEKLKNTHPDWSFHLVGIDFQDDYSKKIKTILKNKKLEKIVYIYGSCNDIDFILQQASIGILTSKFEGLPMALLEYGLSKIPVVVTNVGEIKNLIQHKENGLIVPPNDEDAFLKSLVQLIENEELQKKTATALHKMVLEKYEQEAVIDNYINWLEKIN